MSLSRAVWDSQTTTFQCELITPSPASLLQRFCCGRFSFPLKFLRSRTARAASATPLQFERCSHSYIPLLGKNPMTEVTGLRDEGDETCVDAAHCCPPQSSISRTECYRGSRRMTCCRRAISNKRIKHFSEIDTVSTLNLISTQGQTLVHLPCHLLTVATD